MAAMAATKMEQLKTNKYTGNLQCMTNDVYRNRTYHHLCCEFDPGLCRGELDTT
jgi:hypothetical protein